MHCWRYKSCLNTIKTVKFLDDCTVNCYNVSNDITIRDQTDILPNAIDANLGTEAIKIKYLKN